MGAKVAHCISPAFVGFDLSGRAVHVRARLDELLLFQFLLAGTQPRTCPYGSDLLSIERDIQEPAR
jgi:hypothetical protein